MAGIQIITNNRMDAGWAHTSVADGLHLAFHVVHIGTGSAKVADVSFKVIHLGDQIHFLHDGLLGTAGNELALMGGDGAETASAKNIPGVCSPKT